MNKKFICIFTVLIIFISCPFSYARRVRVVNYPLVRYRVLDRGLSYSGYVSNKGYPFQFAIIDYPEGIAIWLKQKIHWGFVSSNPTLVVLSPYLDYNRYGTSRLSNTNWLSYICENSLVDKIYVVFPKYVEQYPDWKNNLQRMANEARGIYSDPLYLLERLSELPRGDELGKVVLVIDLSFFSNRKSPTYKPELGEIVFQLNSIIYILKDKGIELEALVILEFPEFTYKEHIRLIEEQFLELLRDED
ncbi:MAG: hypothetical protein NC818_05620 [Candidatus Omnitrophica bacterium]|nr:hypothetical protein [Candidatus Omnitrophota bacterium]